MISPQHPDEVKRLAEIILIGFDSDVYTRCRERKHVDGRIAFALLLREQGVGCSDIGRILNRNHATILHYWNRGEALLETDKVFLKRFVKCREEYAGKEPVYYYSGPELRKKFMELRNERNKMFVELQAYKQQAKADRHLEEIFNVVRWRTKRDKLDEVLIRINRVYNGL
ncbi:hypothetical protein [Limnobacter sp.]|uniref:hypothetical protein n=1 Tax=Limnobacter sp. TaxID=2003368 RepID=UPI0025B7B3FE|nr:hypothetical protein [Limnobacter sp.]